MWLAADGFIGAIFRTREYERWFVLFWGCRLLNGFTGTIFHTREYGGVVFVLFLVCGLLNGFIGTIFRTREYEEMLGSLEVGCGVGKKTVDTKKSYPLFIKVDCLVTV